MSSITFHSNNDTVASNSNFVVGGNIEQYLDVGEAFQLGYPTSDENGSSLELFIPMHENSGSTLSDESGNANDATIPDGSSPTLGQSSLLNGTAVQWGGDDWAEVADSAELDFNLDEPQTVMLYVKDNDFSNETFVSKRDPNDNGKGWMLEAPSGTAEFEKRDTDGSFIDKESDTSLSTSNWIQIIVTYDGSGDPSGINFYRNGSKDNSTSTNDSNPANDNSNSNKLFIAQRNDGSNPYSGLSGLLRIYSRELSSTEASNVYSGNFNENVRFDHKSFPIEEKPGQLQLANPDSNLSNLSQSDIIKVKIHRTNDSGTIQETSDEIDLSGSYPKKVTGLSNSGKNFSLEITTFKPTGGDDEGTATYKSLDLESFRSINGTAKAQNATTSGSLSVGVKGSGDVQTQNSNTNGSVTVVPTPVFGSVQAQDSTATGSLSNPASISGTAKADDSTTESSSTTVASISGLAQSQNSTLNAQVSINSTISGKVLSQPSSSTSLLSTIASLSGNASSQESTVSGSITPVAPTISGTAKAQRANVFGSISIDLSVPSEPNFSKVTFRLSRSVGVAESPFSFQTKRTEGVGERWEAELELPPIHDIIRQNEWRSFLVDLSSASGLMEIGDPTYVGPTGNPSGNPEFRAFDSNRRKIKTRGWDKNVTNILKEGDYISIRRELKMVMSDTNSDSNGNATIEIRPPFRRTLTQGDKVEFKNPKGLFQLSENKIDWESEDFRLGIVFAIKEKLKV